MLNTQLQNPKVTADRAFNGFGTNFEESAEPIYGTQFLPRKFKIAVTVPGDNSVDLFTNDLGVVCIFDNDGNVQVPWTALLCLFYLPLWRMWHRRIPMYSVDVRAILQGYNIVVGGGLGRTHRNNDTFPRLADPLGYVDKEDIFHAVKVCFSYTLCQ